MLIRYFNKVWTTFFGVHITSCNKVLLKVQTITKANNGFLLPKKQTKLAILSKADAQDSEFCWFFERIGNTTNCFQDIMTFIMAVGKI